MQNTAKNLKEVLFETLQDLREEKIDVRTADSVAIQAREIVRINMSQKEICELIKAELPDDIKLYALGK